MLIFNAVVEFYKKKIEYYILCESDYNYNEDEKKREETNL